ncbi:MAG: hypothetical protein ACXIUM_13115 [Wenzhouxiangella sp.]
MKSIATQHCKPNQARSDKQSKQRRVSNLHQWLTFAACLLTACMSLNLAATSAEQSVLLPTPPDRAAPILAISADINDEFSVYLASGQAIRFGADNQPRLNFAHPELAHPWPPFGTFEVRDSALGPVVFNISAFVPAPPTPHNAAPDICRAHPLSDGSVLTLFEPSDQVSRQRDAGGGLWGLVPQRGLVRYAANCSSELFPMDDSWRVSRLIAHPEQSAAFVLRSDGKVRLVDTLNVLWDTELPQFGEYPWVEAVRSGVVAGQQLVVAYLGSDNSERLAAIDSQGNLAWTLRAADDQNLLIIQPYQTGVLLVSEDEVVFLDTSGRERWQHAAPADWWPSMAQARPDDPYVWLQYFHSPDSDQRTVAAFQLATGERTQWLVDGRFSVAVGRADGSVVLQDENAFWEGADPLALARADGSVETLLPALKAEQSIQALHRDSHGVLTAAMGSRSSTLHALDSDLAVRWSVTRYAEELGAETGVQVAANLDHVCLLNDLGTGTHSLECFDRANGASRFAPISWEGHAPYLHPLIDQSVEVVSQTAFQSGVVVRRRFDLAGQLVEINDDVLSGLGARDKLIHEVFHSPAGHTLFYYSEAPDQGGFRTERVAVLPPRQSVGSPILSLTLPNPTHSWSGRPFFEERQFALSHDRLAILMPVDGGLLGLAVHDLASGSRLWHQQLTPATSRPEFRIQAAGADWMIATLNAQQLNLMRLASADGATIFEVRHPIAHQPRPLFGGAQQLDAMLISDEDVTAVVSARPGGTRTLWFDNDNGEFLVAAVHPLIAREPWTVRPAGPADDLILAGQAPDANWPAPALTQFSLAARAPAPEAAAEALAGVWFNPATTGQGWFIDFIEGADKIFGAWFTFDDWPASDASGLRWYTMLGDAPGPDGVVSLTLFTNTCGSFESGHPTEAMEAGQVRLWQTRSGGLQMLVDRLWEPGNEWSAIRETIALDLRPGLEPSQRGGIQHWFDPAIAGQGLLLGRPLEDDGPLVAAWFTYDLPGAENELSCQHWFTALGPPSGDPLVGREARLLQTLGGSLDGRPTRNTVDIGQIRMRTFAVDPSGCDTLLFEYDFDDSDVAGPYAGLSGSRLLRTASPCSPP